MIQSVRETFSGYPPENVVRLSESRIVPGKPHPAAEESRAFGPAVFHEYREALTSPLHYAPTVAGVHRFLRRLLRRVGLGRRARASRPRAAAVVVDGDQVLVMKRHKRGRDYAVLPGGGVEAGETAAAAALRELHEETTLVAEIDRLLWTGRHNDRPASYFLVTAVRGRAELSGPEALANRPDNSFELRWVTADRFAELGLHPPDIRAPLAQLLAGRPRPD